MRIHIQVALEYGTMFLHDGYGEVEIPPDTGASPFTFTETCVCFWVPAYLNGDADLTLSDMPFNDLSLPTFSARIFTPTKAIALTDVPVNYYALHRLKAEFADIKIWNYTDTDGEKFWIQVSELDVF